MDERETTQAVRSVRPAHWEGLDLVIGIGYGVVTFVALANGASSATEWAAATIGSIALAAPVAARRRTPVASLLVLLAALCVVALVAPSGVVMALPPIVLVLYTACSRTSLITGASLSLSACVTVLATRLPDLAHPGGIVVALPAFLTAGALGAIIGLQRRNLAVQLELRDSLRRADLRRAELDLIDQRVRIARELHDVVAHGMSVITVQAGFAGLVTEDPGAVRTALDAIETTGRQTLGEMRALLEVLRDDPHDGSPELAPAPRMVDFQTMLDRIREAGVDVTLTCHGPTPALPPLTDLNVYRILQEALTNVVKHSAVRAASVMLEHNEEQIVVKVRNNGRPTSALVETGHGITGMRERARILGGSLQAGPLAEGGFEVAATIPLRDPAMRPQLLNVDSA